MRVDDINVENTSRMVGSYTLGDDNARATWKIKKGTMKIVAFFGDVPSDWTDKQINEYLSKYKIQIQD